MSKEGYAGDPALLGRAFKRALSSYSNEVGAGVQSTSTAYHHYPDGSDGPQHSCSMDAHYDVMVFGAAGIVYLVVNGLLTLLMRLVEHKAWPFERHKLKRISSQIKTGSSELPVFFYSNQNKYPYLLNIKIHLVAFIYCQPQTRHNNLWN